MNEETRSTFPAPLAQQRERLDACLERRNRAEFVAGSIAMAFLIVAAAIGFSTATDRTDAIAAFGLLLVAVGLGLTLLRLKRHVVAQRWRHFGTSQRAALAERVRRERDLLRSVWTWYIAPMLPGFALFWGAMFAGGSVGTALVGAIITAAGIAWIARANLRAAAAFDGQLHQLEPAAP